LSTYFQSQLALAGKEDASFSIAAHSEDSCIAWAKQS